MNNELCVLLPIYNGEKYIIETLESLNTQSFKKFDLYIIDDGSTDDTTNLCRAYLGDRNVSLNWNIIELEENKGLANARNAGWDHIKDEKYKYILSHDCDDISLPRKFEKLFKFMERREDYDIVGTFCKYFSEEDDDMGNVRIESEYDYIFNSFHVLNHFIISATMVRYEVYKECIPFNDEYVVAEDYEFWSRALMKGFKACNIPEFLHKVRRRTNSLCGENSQEMDYYVKIIQDNFRNFLKEYYDNEKN